ncbi:ubiquitin-specific protease C-terminal-domain-containing protein [Mycena rebaudengoi]|nr:ubiquitin-specific protease C-terminal-domain-containing protein [Mycena rebaudengoi]
MNTPSPATPRRHELSHSKHTPSRPSTHASRRSKARAAKLLDFTATLSLSSVISTAAIDGLHRSQNRMQLRYADLTALRTARTPGSSSQISAPLVQNHRAGQICCAVSRGFTTTDTTNGSPKSVVRRSLNQCIAEIMAPTDYVNPTTTVILYEKLDVSIIDLETKRSLRVVWTGIHNKEGATHSFLVPKTSTVNDLPDHISKLVTLTPSGSQKIRVFVISKDGKTQQEFPGFEMIGNTPDPVELYAEEIPLEELEVDDSDEIVGVFHFSKELSRTHGVPFKFVGKPGEKAANTKKRLQARIGASDKDFARYRLALIRVSTFNQPSYIENDDTIYDRLFTPGDVLGLDHIDESGKPRVAATPKPLTIKGCIAHRARPTSPRATYIRRADEKPSHLRPWTSLLRCARTEGDTPREDAKCTTEKKSKNGIKTGVRGIIEARQNEGSIQTRRRTRELAGRNTATPHQVGCGCTDSSKKSGEME